MELEVQKAVAYPRVKSAEAVPHLHLHYSSHLLQPSGPGWEEAQRVQLIFAHGLRN